MLLKLIEQFNKFRSPFWWLRKLYPWSAFGLIILWWVLQRDRRLDHQVRLQKTFFKMNFREMELFMADFVRPELWLM